MGWEKERWLEFQRLNQIIDDMMPTIALADELAALVSCFGDPEATLETRVRNAPVETLFVNAEAAPELFGDDFSRLYSQVDQVARSAPDLFMELLKFAQGVVVAGPSGVLIDRQSVSLDAGFDRLDRVLKETSRIVETRNSRWSTPELLARIGRAVPEFQRWLDESRAVIRTFKRHLVPYETTVRGILRWGSELRNLDPTGYGQDFWQLAFNPGSFKRGPMSRFPRRLQGRGIGMVSSDAEDSQNAVWFGLTRRRKVDMFFSPRQWGDGVRPEACLAMDWSRAQSQPERTRHEAWAKIDSVFWESMRLQAISGDGVGCFFQSENDRCCGRSAALQGIYNCGIEAQKQGLFSPRRWTTENSCLAQFNDN